MKLISENERKKTLIDIGFPKKFMMSLNSLEDIAPDLDCCFSYPEAAYFYLPIIKDFEIFTGYNVVPICDYYTQGSFCAYIFNEVEEKIICVDPYYGDEIY